MFLVEFLLQGEDQRHFRTQSNGGDTNKGREREEGASLLQVAEHFLRFGLQ